MTATCGEEEEPDPTPQQTATPPSTPTAPPAPTSVGVVAENCTTSTCDMKITWSYGGNISGTNQFEVQRKTGSDDNSNWAHVNYIASSSSEYTHAGQPCGSDYTYRVAAEGNGTNGHTSEWGNFGESSTVTAECGATYPAPPGSIDDFVVEVVANDHFDPNRTYRVSEEKPEWGVLAPFDLLIIVTRKGGINDIPVGYKFRLVLDPVSTGLQLSPSGQCLWTDPSTLKDAYKQSNWFTLSTAKSSFNVALKVAQCGKGKVPNSQTPNDGLKVVAKNGSSGSEYAIKSITNIKQAWHRIGSSVTYFIQGSSLNGVDYSIKGVTGLNSIGTYTIGLFPSSRPSILDPTYQPNQALLNHQNYKDSADAWNDVITGHLSLDPTASETNAGIVIKGYWDTHPANGKDPKCWYSIACTHGAGTYPIIGDAQPFWIEDPPRWGDDTKTKRGDQPAAKEWTTKPKEFADAPDQFQYLPAVLMHELGHAIGLQHGVRGETIMRGAAREIEPCTVAPYTSTSFPHYLFECGLANDDKEGAKAIYGP